jgi:hypothetical protein
VQRAYDEADAEVKRIIAEMPSGVDVAEGKAVISDELAGRLSEARGKRLEAVLELWRLKQSWGEGVDPIKAEAALRKAARGGDGPPDAA